MWIKKIIATTANRPPASLLWFLLSSSTQSIHCFTSSPSFLSRQRRTITSSFAATGTKATTNNVEEKSSSPWAPISDEARKLYRKTPLIYSEPLTRLLQQEQQQQQKNKKLSSVFLKLDCLQPSGSFKDRGMAHMCTTLYKTKGISHFVSSSGGNAGLAVATIVAQLAKQQQDAESENDQIKVSVIVPETTKQLVIDRLSNDLGANVTVHGSNWNQADILAREIVSNDPSSAYISPYDDSLLWTGHSTLVDEIYQQQQQEEDVSSLLNMGTLIVSVGGGGLLCGVLEGLERHQTNAKDNSNKKVKVICSETEGAASFGKSWNGNSLIRLNDITSIATSLGALEVTPVALQMAREYNNNNDDIVESSICTDAEAIFACCEFARHHRILVEPACGAALAVLYSPRLRQQFVLNNDNDGRDVVIQVCGGSGVTMDLLQQWKRDYPMAME